ncbi:MAG: hypothetical protein K6F70_00890 [Eggerthellaceae bacterium]|nr:hypothetical protein [Eggerthellaceae bacterium]
MKERCIKGKWAKVIALAMAGIIACFACAACTSSSSVSSASAQGEKVLRIAFPSTLTTLDVANGDGATMLKEVAGVVETLVNVNSDFELQPSLATSWERVDDSTWTIKLREGVKFHDGTDFNADAVKWCFERSLNESTSFASYTHIQSVDVVDDHTVKITTAVPTGELPEALTNVATAIVAPSSVDASGNFVKPVGTGYFQYESFDASTGTFDCVTFDSYWGGAPDSSIAKRHIVSMSDANTRSLAVLNGEIDIATDIPFSDLQTLKDSQDVKVEQFDTARVYFYTFNTNKAYLGDASVRKALLQTLNIDEIVNNDLMGVGSVPNGMFMDDVPWNNTNVTKYPYNAEAAKKALDAAGFVDSDGDGMREYNGEDVKLTLICGSRRPGNPIIVQATQGFFSQIGVDAEVQVLAGNAMSDALSSGAWDMYLESAATGYIPSASYYLSQYFTTDSKNMQRAGYSDPALDAVISECTGLEAGNEKIALSRQAQSLAADDAVVYTVANYGAVFGLNPKITGFSYSAAVHDFIVPYSTDIAD